MNDFSFSAFRISRLVLLLKSRSGLPFPALLRCFPLLFFGLPALPFNNQALIAKS
ncbi:MAG TPA: hypothetical protein VNW97_04715 [Candidatus Saccharimonadales bacterium]|jgi:hypothetical protein|nr:hypothetical protein [Candidatus Saccharimonadales bacterium]